MQICGENTFKAVSASQTGWAALCTFSAWRVQFRLSASCLACQRPIPLPDALPVLRGSKRASGKRVREIKKPPASNIPKQAALFKKQLVYDFINLFLPIPMMPSRPSAISKVVAGSGTGVATSKSWLSSPLPV